MPNEQNNTVVFGMRFEESQQATNTPVIRGEEKHKLNQTKNVCKTFKKNAQKFRYFRIL